MKAKTKAIEHAKLKTVQQLCTPRKNIFAEKFRDYALNLTDLPEGKINADEFFEENFVTEGMETLVTTAFNRFAGKDNISVIKLTQAMGGGKTHNMISLALLAENPEWRKKLNLNIGFKEKVRVASFSGRSTDEEHGIWGSIARQIGKAEMFAEYYRNSLKAPGETAWINLLKGEPLLILLDELPPYFEYAKSVSVGNSDLSVVTTAALANLIVAVHKEELNNVLIVISDLKATYEGGSTTLATALKNLDNEVNRTALELEPVRQNSSEVYHIIKSKLFDSLPDENTTAAIADAYGAALNEARQMDITSTSPEELKKEIKDAYPFHPAVKDLYARFKENPGFQQTRGLIRLLRTQVRSVFSESRQSEEIYLLSPDTFDLNDAETVTEINKVNSTLKNAIDRDIARQGSSHAESMDTTNQTTIYQAVTKTILMSSLSSVPNAVLGLNESDIVYYIVRPGLNVVDLKNKVLPNLKKTCWYMHLDRQGNYLFKNVQNLVAKINGLIAQYNPDQATKEVRKLLTEVFKPVLKDVYQKISILEAPDSINPEVDSVTLIVNKPERSGAGLNADLEKFYQNQVYKNRVLFLTGDRTALDAVLQAAKEILAIDYVIEELDREKLAQSDSQYKEAMNLKDQYMNGFRSAVRETFTRLYYPSNANEKKLMEADFFMNFIANNYNGEEQIRETLLAKQKFTDDIESDTFRKKCEQRLFGKTGESAKEMEWAEIKKRAAREPIWQWHRMDALERLKNKMVRENIWRENGKFVQTGPFPAEKTDVMITKISRDQVTGTMTLRVEPRYGDKVYVDYNADPTTASQLIADHASFQTDQMHVRFLCIDSAGKHPNGPVKIWKNTIDLKYEPVHRDGKVIITLKAIPAAEIKYTTDGSHPRDVGGVYNGPVEVAKKCMVLAIAEKEGIESEILQFEIDPKESSGVKIDDQKPATVEHKHNIDGQANIYTTLEAMKKTEIECSGVRITMNFAEIKDSFINYESENLRLNAEKMGKLIEHLREPFIQDGELKSYTIKLYMDRLHFKLGADIKRFIEALNRPDYKPEEIKQ